MGRSRIISSHFPVLVLVLVLIGVPLALLLSPAGEEATSGRTAGPPEEAWRTLAPQEAHQQTPHAVAIQEMQVRLQRICWAAPSPFRIDT